MDPDMEMYLYQEAATLRQHGWAVTPPRGKRATYGQCVGVRYEGCPVHTPNLRCRWCNKTRRLAYEAVMRRRALRVA